MIYLYGSTAPTVFCLEIQGASTTFAELAQRLATPRRVPLSEKAYHKLSKEGKFKVKDDSYILSCNYTTPVRNSANITSVNLIALDVDENKDAKKLTKEHLDTSLDGLNYIVHETLTSTTKRTRMRILVEADGEMSAAYYTLALEDIANRLSITLTRESKSLCQPMFVPARCEDSDYQFHTNLSGEAYGYGDVSDFSPSVNTEAEVIGANLEQDLLFLVPPAEVELKVLEGALENIDPDTDYHTWLKVCAALKHQFQGSDEGLQMFDKWSSKGDKYVGESDTSSKYRSFKVHPKGRRPVTVWSLFKIAKDAGWEGAKISDNEVDAVLSQIAQASNKELLATAIPRKVSGMTLDPVLRGIIVQAISDRLKTLLFKVPISLIKRACVHREISKSDVYLTDEGFLKSKTAVPEWAEGLVYIKGTDEFCRASTKSRYKPITFSRSFSRYLMTESDKLEGKARPSVDPADYLLNVINCEQYEGYVYVPGGDPVEEFLGADCLNIWRDSRPPMSTENYDEIKEILLDHLARLCGGALERETLMDFLAFNVQFPGKSIRWGVLIQSTHGAGKTFLLELLGKVLGSENVGCPDYLTVSSGYTDWAEGYQVIGIEEIKTPGKNRFELSDKLKALITNEQVTITRKYVSSYKIPNSVNYLLFTNYRDGLAIDNNERRYFIIQSPMQYKSDVDALPKGYFTELFSILKHPGTIRQILSDHQISRGFDPYGSAKATEGFSLMADLSMSDSDGAVLEILENSRAPFITEEIVSLTAIRGELRASGAFLSTKQVTLSLMKQGFLRGERLSIEGVRHPVFYHQSVGKRWRKKKTLEFRNGLLNRDPFGLVVSDLI